MKYKAFDISKPLPFMQGEAIKELGRQYGGIVAAGEIHHANLGDMSAVHVKLRRGKAFADVVAVDQGDSLIIWAFRIRTKPFEQTHISIREGLPLFPCKEADAIID